MKLPENHRAHKRFSWGVLEETSNATTQSGEGMASARVLAVTNFS
jgi:hypothetical protein